MKKPLPLGPRKEPKQARSRQMREDILDAGVRVLQRDGLPRFTTPRVAQVAGVSVGSLYQYFPNKQAILFAIHSRTVGAAWVEVERILDDERTGARQKIWLVTQLFFRAETDDVASMGPSSQDMDHYFEHHPQHRLLNEQVLRRFTRFVREAMPPGTKRARIDFATQLLLAVIDSLGRSVARRQLPLPLLDRWAAAVAEMVADFLGFPERVPTRAPRRRSRLPRVGHP